MNILKLVFPGILIFSLAACAGFSPLYGQNTAARQQLDQLGLAPIEGRAGFLFSQTMMERGGVEASQSKTYVLETVLRKKQANFGVRTDDVSTRARLTITARYTVRDRNGAVTYQGNAEGVAAFDVPDQPYAAIVSERDAEQRAIVLLAEAVLGDLAVFFSSAQKSP